MELGNIAFMINQKYIRNLTLRGSALASLLITPFSYDALNVSKFAVLCITGLSVISLLLTSEEFVRDYRFRSITTTVLAFLSLGFVSVIATHTNFFQQIFGAAGRNTGFITYVALAAFMLGTAYVSDKTFLERIAKYLFCTGVISLAYGLIQVFNFDPLNWTNSFSPVIGFLGNPNFQSPKLSKPTPNIG